jgi:hypothetical protein
MTPLPLADRYARFRDAVFSGIEETRLPGFEVPLTELDLQSLWFAGAFGSEFTSVDGKAVRITDFGTWNSGPGPDFNGCAISVDDQTHHGDIELDPDARDWERHQHGANADYDRVVLHLFFDAPQERFYTRTSQHREIAQVVLNPRCSPTMRGRIAVSPPHGWAAAPRRCMRWRPRVCSPSSNPPRNTGWS